MGEHGRKYIATCIDAEKSFFSDSIPGGGGKQTFSYLNIVSNYSL